MISEMRIGTLVALFRASLTGVAHAQPADPPVISIAEARGLPLRTVVTIDGSVTVPSGAFNSSTLDQGCHSGGELPIPCCRGCSSRLKAQRLRGSKSRA
ncbi:MAG TPA: hypothetical protein VEU30_05945 [Thermoanaerobaculia bacterium]|nr:hypothetical protein [Thermoanaerobaculia bacterium]